MSGLTIGVKVADAWNYIPGEDIEHGKQQIREAMREKARTFGVALTEITFEDVTPDDQRIVVTPEMRKAWPVGTRVIIGTATVKALRQLTRLPENFAGMEFLASLKPHELSILRRVTRDAARKVGQPYLTDAECDAIIAERGPEVGERLIKRAVDGQ